MLPYSTGQTYQVTGHSNKEDYTQEHEYKEQGIIKDAFSLLATPQKFQFYLFYISIKYRGVIQLDVTRKASTGVGNFSFMSFCYFPFDSY